LRFLERDLREIYFKTFDSRYFLLRKEILIREFLVANMKKKKKKKRKEKKKEKRIVFSKRFITLDASTCLSLQLQSSVITLARGKTLRHHDG